MTTTPTPLPAADSGRIFNRRVLRAAVAVAALSLAVTTALALFTEALNPARSAHADTFSRSAVGFWGLRALLDAEGLPVVISRSDTASRLWLPGSALVLLAPPADDLDALRDLAVEARAHGAPILLVAPKWRAIVDATRTGWVERVEPLPAADVAAVLDAVLLPPPERPGHRVTRSTTPTTTWHPLPRALALPRDSPPIDLTRPQLLHLGDHDLEPLITTDRGALLARSGAVWVLSDPDLLANAGLTRGGHTDLTLALLGDWLGADRLVIDEVLHGFEHHPSLWQSLTEFPLAILSLHLLGLLALALWAALQRFGQPIPLPPRVTSGKAALIANTAELLTAAGRAGDGLRRYLDLATLTAARDTALPPDLAPADRLRRLTLLSQARALPTDPATLADRVRRVPLTAGDSRHVRAVAVDIHAWLTAFTQHRPPAGPRPPEP